MDVDAALLLGVAEVAVAGTAIERAVGERRQHLYEGLGMTPDESVDVETVEAYYRQFD